MAEDVTVTITCTRSAATSALLALEGYAERMFSDRDTDPDVMRRYNELGAIVLPLRAARDAAVNLRGTA